MTPQSPDNSAAVGAEREEPSPLSGKRAEIIQRLQVGLFGLAAMVLIVALANIILERAQQTEATAVPEAAATTAPTPVTSPQSDPLVDAGVVPDLPSTGTGQQAVPGTTLPAQGHEPDLAPKP